MEQEALLTGTKPRKALLLQSLERDVLAEIPNAWLFPARGAVRGFLGAGPVMLVAERPSTRNFGGPADRLLYSILERHGLADAHLTDVIKSRGKVGDPYPADIQPHRRIFDREIEIVQPNLIVALGQKVQHLLQFTLGASGIPVRRVWHYSYARRGPDKAAEFERQLTKAVRPGL